MLLPFIKWHEQLIHVKNQSLMYLRGKKIARRILQNSFVIIFCLILSAICASVIDYILYISFNILQIHKKVFNLP